MTADIVAWPSACYWEFTKAKLSSVVTKLPNWSCWVGGEGQGYYLNADNTEREPSVYNILLDSYGCYIQCLTRLKYAITGRQLLLGQLQKISQLNLQTWTNQTRVHGDWCHLTGDTYLSLCIIGLPVLLKWELLESLYHCQPFLENLTVCTHMFKSSNAHRLHLVCCFSLLFFSFIERSVNFPEK